MVSDEQLAELRKYAKGKLGAFSSTCIVEARHVLALLDDYERLRKLEDSLREWLGRCPGIPGSLDAALIRLDTARARDHAREPRG